jgi:hypothetical protein
MGRSKSEESGGSIKGRNSKDSSSRITKFETLLNNCVDISKWNMSYSIHCFITSVSAGSAGSNGLGTPARKAFTSATARESLCQPSALTDSIQSGFIPYIFRMCDSKVNSPKQKPCD